MMHVNSFYGIERTITISFYIDIAPSNVEFKTQKENSLQIFLTKKNLCLVGPQRDGSSRKFSSKYDEFVGSCSSRDMEPKTSSGLCHN